MFEDTYEVSREEFRGFVQQIKPECIDSINLNYEDYYEVKLVSKDGQRHFASIKQYPKEEDVHYFVYEMPLVDESQAAKPVRTIVLETKEEVKAFFKALKEAQEKNNARNISRDT